MSKRPIPKDLGLKVLTKDQKLWTDIIASIKRTIDASKNEIKINIEFLKMAQEKLKKLN